MNNRFLDPSVLAKVGNMELIARQVVEGFISGRHRSPYHGFSVEYADHRQYVPGDEIRTIDWRVLARSDKIYVKLYEEETNLRAHLIMDISRSMAFHGRPKDAGTLSKHQYAAFLGASLAYLLIRQNDSVGLALVDSGVRKLLPPKASPRQFRRILDALGDATTEQDTGLGGVFHELAERIRGRGLIIVFSDMLDDVDAVMSGLQHLRHRRHEILLFHMLDPVERDFPFDRMSKFQDMEGAGTLVANPKALRAAYLERLEKFMERLGTECRRNRIDYHLVCTDQPYDRFLGHFLERRARLG